MRLTYRVKTQEILKVPVLHQFPNKIQNLTGTVWTEFFWQRSCKIIYSNIQPLMQKFQFEPKRILNMDETGVSNVQAKFPSLQTNRTQDSWGCYFLLQEMIFPWKQETKRPLWGIPTNVPRMVRWILSCLVISFCKGCKSYFEKPCGPDYWYWLSTKKITSNITSLPPNTSDHLQPLD